MVQCSQIQPTLFAQWLKGLGFNPTFCSMIRIRGAATKGSGIYSRVSHTRKEWELPWEDVEECKGSCQTLVVIRTAVLNPTRRREHKWLQVFQSCYYLHSPCSVVEHKSRRSTVESCWPYLEQVRLHDWWQQMILPIPTRVERDSTDGVRRISDIFRNVDSIDCGQWQ